jgi:hypothetical protein
MKAFINGGVRSVLVLLAGVLLVGTVSCGGGGGGAVREVDGQGNGKGKTPPAVPTVAVSYANGYQITVQGKNVHSVHLAFASGVNEVYMLSKQGTCFSANKSTLEVIHVLSKGGDYWYFDGAGFPITEDDGRKASGLLGNLLGGTLGLVGKIVKPNPVIKVRCTGGPYDKTASGNAHGHSKKASGLFSTIVNVSANVAFTSVKVATSTDTVLTFSTSATTSGNYDTEASVTVDAVQVTLAADGSKWYFDAAGNVLPADSKWYTDLD